MSITISHLQRGSYLMPSLGDATVSDAMHPGILACEPDASLQEVAQMMATHHVHCLAVIGVSHEEPPCGVWSVISGLDLVRAGVTGEELPSARAIAKQPVASVEPSMPLREVGELMLTRGVSHLVVVQPESQRPLGILSTADIAGVIAWGEA